MRRNRAGRHWQPRGGRRELVPPVIRAGSGTSCAHVSSPVCRVEPDAREATVRRKGPSAQWALSVTEKPHAELLTRDGKSRAEAPPKHKSVHTAGGWALASRLSAQTDPRGDCHQQKTKSEGAEHMQQSNSTVCKRKYKSDFGVTSCRCLGPTSTGSRSHWLPGLRPRAPASACSGPGGTCSGGF